MNIFTQNKQEEQSVRVTDDSQDYVLEDALEGAAVSHNFMGDVLVPMVRIDRSAVLYFCDVSRVQVISQDRPGDGQDLPEDVRLTNTVTAPPPGYYNLHGYLSVNGEMALEIKRFEPIPA